MGRLTGNHTLGIDEGLHVKGAYWGTHDNSGGLLPIQKYEIFHITLQFVSPSYVFFLFRMLDTDGE